MIQPTTQSTNLYYGISVPNSIDVRDIESYGLGARRLPNDNNNIMIGKLLGRCGPSTDMFAYLLRNLDEDGITSQIEIFLKSIQYTGEVKPQLYSIPNID